MPIRRLRTLLWALSITLSLASLSAVSWAVWWPYHASLPQSTPATREKSASDDPGLSFGRPTLSQFEGLWDKRLRRPLYDPPPPTPKVAEVKKLPPLQIKLLGTIIEPGKSQAMLATPRGTVELKRVGDTIDSEQPPAELVTIERDRVVLKRQGDLITLEIKTQ